MTVRLASIKQNQSCDIDCVWYTYQHSLLLQYYQLTHGSTRAWNAGASL